jgi:hypothetical protein
LDLAKWYESTNLPANPATLKSGNVGLLLAAVAESPSGVLYRDLSQVATDITNPVLSGYQQVILVVQDTTTAENACQAVNPNQ